MKFFQVIITTYGTLSQDFTTPEDIEPGEELEWLLDNGYGSYFLRDISSALS